MDFRVSVTIRASILPQLLKAPAGARSVPGKRIAAGDTRARVMNEHVGRLCYDSWNLRPTKRQPRKRFRYTAIRRVTMTNSDAQPR